ncbi:DUF1641 domain-containing protein [Halobacillus massiliensis]|uniref:DUF1641 domain-containing protein n=1 Tax=Halobacillus massiliensis TaxID=1926286 RepID=UPI0009E2BC70|nr:DUF1641 domain-containing protein [Halobacillus massiliensis]
MAKAIKQIDKTFVTPEKKQQEDLNLILNQLAQNKESILLMVEIIEELRKFGLLDIAKGMLKTRHELGILAMEELDKPTVHDLVKSGIGAFNFITKVDPKQLDRILNGASEGLKGMTENLPEDEKLGMWGLVKSMRDPEVNRSLTAMVHFLKGMGHGLKND